MLNILYCFSNVKVVYEDSRYSVVQNDCMSCGVKENVSWLVTTIKETLEYAKGKK